MSQARALLLIDPAEIVGVDHLAFHGALHALTSAQWQKPLGHFPVHCECFVLLVALLVCHQAIELSSVVIPIPALVCALIGWLSTLHWVITIIIYIQYIIHIHVHVICTGSQLR